STQDKKRNIKVMIFKEKKKKLYNENEVKNSIDKKEALSNDYLEEYLKELYQYKKRQFEDITEETSRENSSEFKRTPNPSEKKEEKRSIEELRIKLLAGKDRKDILDSQIEVGLDRLELDNSITEEYSDKLDSMKLNQDLFEVYKASETTW
ncbi:3596_t:CDS:2, partial [Ambispora leptoticha]